MFSAMRAYELWRTAGPWDGLVELYTYRGSKPILHQVLAFPFLVLSGGNVRLSVAIVNISLLIVFMIFLYKLLRHFFSAPASALAAGCIGSLPWVMRATFMYQAELPVMAAAMGCVYFLFRSRGFQSARESLLVGINFGLALCFQPAVTIISLGATVLVQSLLAIRGGSLRWNDLGMATAPVLMLMAAALIELRMYLPLPTLIVVFYFLFTMWFIFWRIKIGPWGLSLPYFLAVLSSALIFSLWMLPFLKEVIDWAYTSAYSDISKIAGLFSGGPILGSLFFSYGNFAALFFIGLVAVLGYKKLNDTDDVAKIFTILAPLIFVPPLIGATSHTGDYRYYCFGFTMLYTLGTIALFLTRDSLTVRTVKKLLLLLGVFNIALLFQNIVLGEHRLVKVSYELMGRDAYLLLYWRMPPSKSAENETSVVHALQAAINPASKEKTNVAVRYPFDKYEFNLIAMEKRLNLFFHDTLDGDWPSEGPPDLERFVDGMRRSFDYVLVGPLNRDIYNEGWPYMNLPMNKRGTELLQKIMERWRDGRLSELGMTPVTTLSPANSDLEYVLLKAREI